jgi:hypothetical protein
MYSWYGIQQALPIKESKRSGLEQIAFEVKWDRTVGVLFV